MRRLNVTGIDNCCRWPSTWARTRNSNARSPASQSPSYSGPRTGFPWERAPLVEARSQATTDPRCAFPRSWGTTRGCTNASRRTTTRWSKRPPNCVWGVSFYLFPMIFLYSKSKLIENSIALFLRQEKCELPRSRVWPYRIISSRYLVRVKKVLEG